MPNPLEIQVVDVPLYRGEEQRLVLSQGFHGPFHKLVPTSMNLDYAVDIAAPLGSIVVAARDGIVRGMSMSSGRYFRQMNFTTDEIARWTKDTLNFILLEHEGGLQTLYGHLEKGSQRVKVEQRVRAGSMLAHTGLSGWVGDIDNLHFQMHRWGMDGSGPKRKNSTVPFRFRGHDDFLEHRDLFARR